MRRLARCGTTLVSIRFWVAQRFSAEERPTIGEAEDTVSELKRQPSKRRLVAKSAGGRGPRSSPLLSARPSRKKLPLRDGENSNYFLVGFGSGRSPDS